MNGSKKKVHSVDQWLLPHLASSTSHIVFVLKHGNTPVSGVNKLRMMCQNSSGLDQVQNAVANILWGK